MCLGETRTLTVPPQLGYGENGYPGIIPGNSILHFTVELVEMEKGDVQIHVLKESKECQMKAELGDHLKVHYTGRFEDENGKVFDSGLYQFQLGAGQV